MPRCSSRVEAAGVPIVARQALRDWSVVSAVSDPLPVPERVLAIGAHPDDIEFGCGATLARWAAAGCVVDLLVLTDGAKGTWDAQADLAALVAARQAEQLAAAEALGAHEVHFFDVVDGELETTRALTAAVCDVIRAVRPTVVLGHDPWKRYRLHPDHRHAGWITLDAIVAARDPHFFPEQPHPHHRPTAVLLFEADVVDHHEPVDETALTAKIEALMRHRSQWRSTHGIDQDPEREIPEFASWVRSDTTTDRGKLAEEFKLITEL
jgi:LmbE family N-acetylglucosaminyl deacetylase